MYESIKINEYKGETRTAGIILTIPFNPILFTKYTISKIIKNISYIIYMSIFQHDV